jgi:hypothetical protein
MLIHIKYAQNLKKYFNLSLNEDYTIYKFLYINIKFYCFMNGDNF